MQICSVGSLDPMKVKGKIVYCLGGVNLDDEKSMGVAQAEGAGMILANRLTTQVITPRAHFVPTSHVSAADGLSILFYISNTKSPVAYISGTTEVGSVAAPIMASFSSPGPNTITPEILKPDITAPGVSIWLPTLKLKGLLLSNQTRALFSSTLYLVLRWHAPMFLGLLAFSKPCTLIGVQLQSGLQS
ncbi:PA domain-containing protein [Cephalotus follicularis]|uniref:PA domain-containing protein n=1 Tax=Cephalotus follicularis TaxID=3775 RepID=A0A1Q3B5N1_CEPFO|nr:PA domain-containing protein [Cephalotus follicularis]